MLKQLLYLFVQGQWIIWNNSFFQQYDIIIKGQGNLINGRLWNCHHFHQSECIQSAAHSN